MIRSAYSDVFEIFRRYWTAYGGFQAFATSPYLHAAGIITILCWPVWVSPQWWDDPIGVLPDLLGFTLGGLAILLGLFEEKIVQLLSHEPSQTSPSALQEIIATFVHFIVIQTLALIIAFIFKGVYTPIPDLWFIDVKPELSQLSSITRPFLWGVGYLLFVYALVLVLAATMAVFRLSRMLELIHRTCVDVGQSRNGEPE